MGEIRQDLHSGFILLDLTQKAVFVKLWISSNISRLYGNHILTNPAKSISYNMTVDFDGGV